MQQHPGPAARRAAAVEHHPRRPQHGLATSGLPSGRQTEPEPEPEPKPKPDLEPEAGYDRRMHCTRHAAAAQRARSGPRALAPLLPMATSALERPRRGIVIVYARTRPEAARKSPAAASSQPGSQPGDCTVDSCSARRRGYASERPHAFVSCHFRFHTRGMDGGGRWGVRHGA